MQQTKEKAPCTTTIVQDAKTINLHIQDTIKQLESQASDLDSDLSGCDIPILDVLNVLYKTLEIMEYETVVQKGTREDTIALVFFRRVPDLISMLRISLHELGTVRDEIERQSERAFGILKALRDLQTEITNP